MYALRTITPPTFEPVTIAEIRAHSRLDSTEPAAQIAGRAVAARTYLEALTGRAFITQTLEVVLDQFPRGAIVMPRAPVASITSISYTAPDGSAGTVTQYALDGIGLPPTVSPAYGEQWPEARRAPGSVVVRFVAGESAAPLPIKQALLLLIADWNENREKPSENNAVNALIAPYRVHLA